VTIQNATSVNVSPNVMLKRKEYKWNKISEELIEHDKVRGFIYETSKGKKIPVKDLDTNHIKNILAKIKREEDWREQLTYMLKFELVYRQVHNLK